MKKRRTVRVSEKCLKRELKKRWEGNIINVLKRNFSDECWKILLEYLEATGLRRNLRIIFTFSVKEIYFH